MTTSLSVTISVPTYRREQVLIDTVESLLRLEPAAAEILVVDQTTNHAEQTEASLRNWNAGGQIRWIRLAKPSIPRAMNEGLLHASNEIVLFLDDDIVPFPDLIEAHFEAHRNGARLTAGRVLQPWDTNGPAASWAERQFSSTESIEVDRFMGGNFSVRRIDAVELGGFDENFVRVAYNFERDFADRWRARGGKIQFCPGAGIRHLRASTGGTRSFGEHLTTLFPAHSVGNYYYLLCSMPANGRVRALLAQPIRAVMTRHHLRRPWWIPVTIVANLAGMLWAVALHVRGPRYCSARARESGKHG